MRLAGNRRRKSRTPGMPKRERISVRLPSALLAEACRIGNLNQTDALVMGLRALVADFKRRRLVEAAGQFEFSFDPKQSRERARLSRSNDPMFPQPCAWPRSAVGLPDLMILAGCVQHRTCLLSVDVKLNRLAGELGIKVWK